MKQGTGFSREARLGRLLSYWGYWFNYSQSKVRAGLLQDH